MAHFPTPPVQFTSPGPLPGAPGGARLRVRWEERDGPPVAPPSHKGFGSQVLERGLEHKLEGKVLLEYLPGGLICTIDLPGPKGAPDG